MSIVIDTDILIDLIKGVKSSRQFIESQDEICFSAITELELVSGKKCDDGAEREKVLSLLSSFTKIDVGNQIALLGGDIRRKSGISAQDAVIAATAISLNSELASRNKKDFSRVAGLKLKIPY